MSELAKNVPLSLVVCLALSLAATEILAGPPAPVAATGQTISYATGDDGDKQSGVALPDPRFVDNTDGTVTDRLTGLVWLRNADCFGLVTWNDGLTLAEQLIDGSCGLSDDSEPGDWRLPNVLELVGLIDFGQHLPALSPGHPFAGVQTDFYWSSTTLDNVNSRGRPVHMGFGNIDQRDKAGLSYVWPVRDQR